MSVDGMPIDEMFVIKLIVNEMSVDEITRQGVSR